MRRRRPAVRGPHGHAISAVVARCSRGATDAAADGDSDRHAVPATDTAAWELLVDNWTAYRDDLFVPVSVLRPCEGVMIATRTWLEIRGADGLIVQRCDLAGPEDLARLWVPTAPWDEPPYPLHVRVWDRLTNRVVVSDAIGRPGPTPSP